MHDGDYVADGISCCCFFVNKFLQKYQKYLTIVVLAQIEKITEVLLQENIKQ